MNTVLQAIRTSIRLTLDILTLLVLSIVDFCKIPWLGRGGRKIDAMVIFPPLKPSTSYVLRTSSLLWLESEGKRSLSERTDDRFTDVRIFLVCVLTSWWTASSTLALMLLRALCSKIPSQIPVTTARNSLWLSSVLGSPHRRTFSSRTVKGDDLNVSHSQFLHGAGPKASWKSGEKTNIEPSEDELEGIEDGMGKILPTRSHLFKLILPLMALKKTANDPSSPSQPSLPLVILLHPSQPLSHVSRLIISFLRTPRKSTPPEISFESTPDPHHKGYEWSDSTDVGDFIRDAARTAEFTISFKYPEEETHAQDDNIKSIRVRVPTFADRTIFMRRRLSIINAQLSSMEKLKADCDHEAHRGARRMALSGFGMLVVYWGTVARLTFWDFGWEVMEPITYLSGLSTVICGYLWFLYQGREVSYSSVLDRSISARREAAYIARGLDIDKWLELIAERKTVQKDIARIAEDYNQSAEGGEDEKKPKDTVV